MSTRFDNSRADTTYILKNFYGNNLIYIYQNRFQLTCRSGRECYKFFMVFYGYKVVRL